MINDAKSALRLPRSFAQKMLRKRETCHDKDYAATPRIGRLPLDYAPHRGAAVTWAAAPMTRNGRLHCHLRGQVKTVAIVATLSRTDLADY
jgi:hypothetical protein